MSAVSTSTIAATSSASTAAAKTDSRDAAADASPFAILLAATLQDASTPQPQATAAPAATDSGTPAASIVDSALEPTPLPPPSATSSPSSSTTDDNGAVTQSGGKRDKKTDPGKSKDADISASDRQALQAALNMSIPASIQPVVPPVVQAASQPSQPDNDAGDSDDSADLASTISSAAATSAKSTASSARSAQAGSNNSAGTKSADNKAADPQTPPQPSTAGIGDAKAVTPAPATAQAAIAPDNGDTDTDADTDIADAGSSQLAANAKTGETATQLPTGTPPANQTADISVIKGPATNRSTAGQSPSPAANKSAAQQPPSQAMADDDAEPDAQSAAGPTPVPPTGNQTAQIAVNAAASSAQDDDASTDAAQASGSAPDIRKAAQASKPADKQNGRPVQPASAISTPSLATAAPTAESDAAALKSDGKETGTDKTFAQTLAGNTGDAKSTHADATDATPQPVPPAPPVHSATPANTAPQITPLAVTVGANQPAGASNMAPTASVHLANVGADPTPDTNALAVSVAARSLSGARQFDIRLDPAELGHVEVRLSIDASGKTQAHMTADQPQTLALLQKDAPNLTQALRDAGLNVSQGGLNFSLRGQDRQNGDRNNGAGQGRRTNLTATRAIGAAQGPMPVSYNSTATDARVDIHV